MFTLLTRLLDPVQEPASPLPRRQPPLAETEAEAGLGDEHTPGCGWYDSSHELLNGVTVWEGIVVVDNTVARAS
jgi:hypothetical protein